MNSDGKSTILIIDNNPDTVNYLRDLLHNFPYEIVSTPNEQDGYKLILSEPEKYSAIILGQNMQNSDSLSLLHKINSSSTTKTIPVIMEAENGSIEDMEICIRAGARYYMLNPVDKRLMPDIIATAIRDQTRYSLEEAGAIDNHPTGNTLISATFKLRTLQEAQAVANLISSECPNPRLAAVGITEMLINAIEHGNLGISYSEKTKLHEQEMWLTEIARRLALEENAEKFVTVKFGKSASHINIRITDQGNGFNWREYQTLDTKRVFDNHGRGIVMARNLTFESLIYHDNGNDVECIIPLIST